MLSVEKNKSFASFNQSMVNYPVSCLLALIVFGCAIPGNPPDKPIEVEEARSIHIRSDSDDSACHLSRVLFLGESFLLDGFLVKLARLSDDAAGFEIGDALYSVSVGERLQANSSIELTAIRQENAFLCIRFDVPFDENYCAGLGDSDRSFCFDTLGFRKGEAYCEKIEQEADRNHCIGGATGQGG
jgi:hypothetical protein